MHLDHASIAGPHGSQQASNASDVSISEATQHHRMRAFLQSLQ